MKHHALRRIAGYFAAAAAVLCSSFLPPGAVVGAESDDNAQPAGANAQPAGAPLAWIRFENGPEQYAGVPYLWLGDVDIKLAIDIKPRTGHVLELLCGCKNDDREALVTINGREVKLRTSGYDGFRWTGVPVPEKIAGDGYEISITRTYRRPAFLAGARLVASDQIAVKADADPKQPAHRITLSTTKAAAYHPVVFPEMQAIWDREPPAPKTPPADPEQEALFRRAELHARQANEQFYRCRRFVDGWLACADPKTGLLPRNLGRDRDIWNAKDCAADNYPFIVLTAALTDRPLFDGRMLDMLRTETRLTCRIDRLPDTWSFSRQAFATDKPNLDSIIFGSSEYVKDGLVPLTEWLGRSPWSVRMIGIIDDIFKHAPVETPYGNIPSTNVEVNGEMLQSLSRIYWMTGDKKYLDYAVRLGDYYLLGGHHPTRDFTSLRLRDHGCEITGGLSELYVALHFVDPEKKKAYGEPIHAMFDRILEVGRDEHGMLYSTINPQTGQHSRGICDTWGYNYNGMYAVYLIDKTEAYRRAVRKVLGNLTEHITDYNWGSADEFADSIEGAINLYNRERVSSATTWIDSEIKDMWSKQRPDGVLEGWYGDGNSARTAIMYALWKTQGLSIRPWRADVRFGTVRKGDTLYVSLTADKPWEGKLLFDKPRHKVQMHLPLDYPRLNQFPEWFVAEAGGRYSTLDVSKAGSENLHTGRELQEGLPVKLEPGRERRVIVRPKG